ncbi:MAG: AsmA family protein [Desulfovibrio sp.]
MTKTIKRLLLIVGGLAALLVAALIFVALFVDPNDYKDRITQTVRETTGMELTIDGDLSLHVFPWIGVDTGAIRLGNPPGFGDEPFVSLQSSSVSLQVLPLLSGSIKAGQIDVQGLTVNLIRNKDGAANWEAIGGEKDPATSQESQDSKSGSSSGLDLSIGGLKVNDANIVFDDLQAGKRYALEGLNLALGEVVPGEPFDMEASLSLQSSQPQVKATVGVKAVAALDLEKKIYELRNLDAGVEAEGDVVPGGKTEVTAKAASVLADLTRQIVTTEGLTVSAYGVDVAAELAASELDAGPKAKGSVAVKPFDLKKLLASLGQTPPETTDPTALTNLSLSLDFDYGPAAAVARNVILSLDGQEITAEASMIAGDVPSYGIKVQAASLDLDPYRAPKSEQTAQPAETAPTDSAAANQPLLPESVQEQLRKLRLDAEIKIGRLKVSPAEITNLLVLITARDGLLKVEPASFTCFEGDLKSALSMDVRGTLPNYGLNADLNGLAIGPLLEALQGKESLSGTTNAEAALTVRGNTVDELKQTLNGNLRFDIHDGVFPGVDLAGVMTKAYKSLQAKADGEIETEKDARTQFGLVQGSATITNGLVDNRDLLFKSPFLQGDGEGQVNLPGNSVNYLVVGAILASTEGQGRGDKEDYFGIGIPIRIKGDFANLHFWPDPVKWAEMIASGALNILGDGASGVLKAPGALLDAVGGSSTKSGTGDSSATEKPASEKSNPIKDIGGAVKSLF